MTLKPKQIESGRQRGWFEGGLIPLITFYQDGMDHHNSEDNDRVREWLKMEFNADFVEIGGKTHKIAKSTSGELQEVIERVLRWAEEQGYQTEVLEPQRYKKWKDEIYPYGGPDNYIDYCLEIKTLV